MHGVVHCKHVLTVWHSNDSCLSVKLLKVVDIIINVHIICTYSCKWMGMKLCMYDNQSSQRLHTEHSIDFE